VISINGEKMNWQDAIRIGFTIVEIAIFSLIGVTILSAILAVIERGRK